MWNRRQGTFFADPTDSSYAYPHYHGSSRMPKKYLTYDGSERFQHPQGMQQAGRMFDVAGNPYQPPFARAMAGGLDVGKPGWRAQRLGLSIPDQATYGDYYSGGARGAHPRGKYIELRAVTFYSCTDSPLLSLGWTQFPTATCSRSGARVRIPESVW